MNSSVNAAMTSITTQSSATKKSRENVNVEVRGQERDNVNVEVLRINH